MTADGWNPCILDPDREDRPLKAHEWIVEPFPQERVHVLATKNAGYDSYRWPIRGVHERKARLLACALCRLSPAIMANGFNRRAVEVAERFADALTLDGATVKNTLALRMAYTQTCKDTGDLPAIACMEDWTRILPRIAERLCQFRTAGWELLPDGPAGAALINRTIRALFDPFHKHEFPWRSADGCLKIWQCPSDPYVQYLELSTEGERAVRSPWRPPHVVHQALEAYDLAYREGRGDTIAHDRLAVLADALEEAGCTDRVLTATMRHPQIDQVPRGFWPLDAVLGKPQFEQGH